jgi:NADH-quinone oxidoreductase subunit F
MSRFLTAFIDDPSLEAYQNKGGYTGFHAALKLTPKQVTETIKKSGLRGRGGAGFPTGLKWETVTKGETCYIVCNADEGEPGTFKDRLLLEKSPHLILEGMLISAYANGATQGFIYIRGEYPKEALILQNALDEARAANLLGKRIGQSDFSFDIEIYRGGGSYVVGDETALLNSLMGFRGNPWHKPPYPTQSGLWDSPTVVNNVETLSCVALVMQKGADWFVSIGTPESPGPKLFCVSGNVERPGVYEFPMGTTLKEVLDAAGVKGALKAVQIGGTAGPVYGTRSVAPMGETNGAHSLATSDSDYQMVVVDYKLDYAFMKQVGGCDGCYHALFF